MTKYYKIPNDNDNVEVKLIRQAYDFNINMQLINKDGFKKTAQFHSTPAIYMVEFEGNNFFGTHFYFTEYEPDFKREISKGEYIYFYIGHIEGVQDD